jgi:hypothetical protein
LHVEKTDAMTFIKFNKMWHSRLPVCRNAPFSAGRVFFVATFHGAVYAVAFWSFPVARNLNGKGFLELRRFAIAPDAPPNTASRTLAIMARIIKESCSYINRLVSYQDCEVHTGTIYKATGWVANGKTSGGNGWESRAGRRGTAMQSKATKIRWELSLEK